jgi:hypothetical protein
VVPLRPLTVGELLDGAVSVIRRYPRPTLGLSAVVALATTLVNLVFVLSLDLGAVRDQLRTGTTSTSVNAGGAVSSTGSSVPGGLVGALAGLVLTGALVVVVGKAVLGRATTFGEVWDDVRPRLLALLGLALLTGLIAGAPAVLGVIATLVLYATLGSSSLLLGIPLALGGLVGTVYLYTRLSLAPAVLVLEKARIRTALSRSGALVRGSWWRVFLLLLLTWLISVVVAGVLVVPVELVKGAPTFGSQATTGSAAAFVVLTQVVAGLASLLVSPFSAGVRALLYVDRRMRAEGLDLTLQAAAQA